MIRMTTVLFMAVILCSASFVRAAKSAPNVAVTREDVVKFVEKAVVYAHEKGKDEARKAFMDPKSGFIQGELYIYAYDFDGTVISHGGQPDLVGENLFDMKDPNGVAVIQELIKRAQQGGGWLDYMWANPLNQSAIEPKAGYVLKIDDTWFLGSGFYPAARKK